MRQQNFLFVKREMHSADFAEENHLFCSPGKKIFKLPGRHFKMDFQFHPRLDRGRRASRRREG
jgi:hypothetical protein